MIKEISYYYEKFRILIKEKGLFQGTIAAFLYTLKIPLQDNFLYRVSNKKWQNALNKEFKMFSNSNDYAFHKIKYKTDFSEIRALLYDEAKGFLLTYERLCYPFTAMFKAFVKQEHPKVLQLAVGVTPELVHLVEELGIDYYVEDPLFPEIFQSVDLKAVFKKEIKEFCNLPAETMWKEYQEFFDVIVCHNVLNHTRDPGKVIDSMSKMLKPEGLIFDFTMRQPSGSSHPGIIGRRALIRGYTSRGFEIIYSAVFKHLDFPSYPQKQRYYTLLRKKGAMPL